MNALTVSPQGPLTPWPSAAKLKQLAEKLDALNWHYQRLWKLHEEVVETTGRLPTKGELALARSYIETYERSKSRAALLDGDLDRLHDECIPADWWDRQDATVRESAVARAVAMLLGSFPNGVKDPEIFVPQMIEDVLSWNPHFFAVHDACRKLRHTLKFTPSIAELKEAFDAAREKWIERWNAQEFAEQARGELAKLIASREKTAAIRCGCHVRHPEFGIGTVKVIEGFETYFVLFDGSRETRKVKLMEIEAIPAKPVEANDGT
jgi:hypothetical protein